VKNVKKIMFKKEISLEQYVKDNRFHEIKAGFYFKKKYYCHLKFLIKYKGEILKEKKKE
jgi:hypothetical protein